EGAVAPGPPFWFASALSVYPARRSPPISIDYVDLVAHRFERRAAASAPLLPDDTFEEPLLIEASGFAELIQRRGEDALKRYGRAATLLVSTRGSVPDAMPENSVLAIAAWPPDLERLDALFARATSRWGVAVPVLHPITTSLTTLASLADLARDRGASFFASFAVQIEPAAKQELARNDDDAYELLFHGDVDLMQVTTERHIAALADERGMLDFIPPPRWEEKSNWNAAMLLTLTASRMIAMDYDVELAGTIARSARAIAQLDKPIERIAEAASLSIVEALDEVSVDLLSEWLESGRASFAERVNSEWRLRGDAGLSNE